MIRMITVPHRDSPAGLCRLGQILFSTFRKSLNLSSLTLLPDVQRTRTGHDSTARSAKTTKSYAKASTFNMKMASDTLHRDMVLVFSA